MIGWRVGWVAGPAETIEDAGWAHVYNTTTPVGLARAAAAAVLRGQQDHVADCVAELERRRDVMLAGLPDWPFVRPGGGWSMLLDVSDLGFEARAASRLLLEESCDRRDGHGRLGRPRGRPPRSLRVQRGAGRPARDDPRTARRRHPGRRRRRAELSVPEHDALVAELSREGLAELHTHLGGSVDPAVMWTLAHEQGIALPDQGLLGLRRARHRRPARRRGAARARRDLQVDRADPVEPAGRRALRPRRHRRGVPHPEHHHARAPLQPDEAQPRRRARPRPHHHGLLPRPRPRAARVPEGARRPDPDDGPHLHPRAERGHRREGDPLLGPRSGRRGHRGAPARRRALPVPRPGAARRGGARGRPRRHHPRGRGGRAARDRRDRRGHRAPAARAHRARHPRRRGRGDHADAAGDRDRPGDLPELEPPHRRPRRPSA